MGFNEFISPLHLEDKIKNMEIINGLLNEDENVQQWIKYINNYLNSDLAEG